MPGCGKGYDVALFAAYGYDAYGLEVSSHAADAARKYLEEPGKGPLEGEYAVMDEKIGRGAMRVVCGDYFKDGWLGDVEGWENDEGFDIMRWTVSLCTPSLSKTEMGISYHHAPPPSLIEHHFYWRCAHLSRIPYTQARIFWRTSVVASSTCTQ